MELYWSNIENSNSGKPILSIITPIYNRMNYLNVMLKSILHQKYRLNGYIELIVMDDCSDLNYPKYILI